MPEGTERKAKSHRRIVAAAGRRLRAAGLDGAGVAEIMAEAGLTHGGFYAHFADKAALVEAALEAALAESREAWLAGFEGLTAEEAYRQIVGRYLSRGHRDAPASGCAMAALGSELARAPEAIRGSFESAFEKTLAALEAHMPEGSALGRRERAAALLALAMGGVTLARMVVDPALSDMILLACRRAALAALAESAALPPAGRTG